MTRWSFIAISVIVTAHLSLAQDVTGTWGGAMPRRGVGGTLVLGQGPRWVVTLSKNSHGVWNGTMAQMSQGSDIFSLSTIVLNGPRLSFSVAIFGGVSNFTGTLSDDGYSIDGWFQGLPLKLERSGHAHSAKTPTGKTAAPTPTAPEAVVATPAPVPTAESSVVLSRALAKLKGTSERLLRYTCLETVERSYYSEPKQLGAHAMSEAPAQSCEGKAFSEDGRLRLDADDRLRLEVAIAGGKEIHSWAAANRFDSRSVFEMIPNGPMSTGAFGSALVDIFENAGAHYNFSGVKSDGSRALFEYTFEVPLQASHSSVQAGSEWIKTGYRGSFQIEAATSNLVRLTIETDQLPLETKMCRNRRVIDYHYAPIGEGQFLIPLKSGFDVLRPDGDETRSVTTFSACHEYAAESSLVFDGAAPLAEAKVTPKAAKPLPSGLSLTLVLQEAIDTRTAAAGDAVSAKVARAVRGPGSNEILVDAGAVAHGRITQMQHQYNSSQFLFAIRFETLEQRGAVAPLAIELDRELKAEQARGRSGFASRGTEFSIPAPSAPGEAGSWFTAPATSGGYVLKAGSESKWTTVAK